MNETIETDADKIQRLEAIIVKMHQACDQCPLRANVMKGLPQYIKDMAK